MPDIDILSDGHIHTRYCHHATGTMEEYIQQAIKKGLREIIFLEHMEAGIDYFETTWLTENDFDSYFNEGYTLQEKYQDRLSIKLGVEVGYNPACRWDLLSRLEQRSWDKIGVSYHFHRLAGHRQHINLVSRKEKNIKAIAARGCEDVLTDYYSMLIEAVQALPGTTLCHLDAGLRFQPDAKHTPQHLELIHQLLDIVKEKEMALEINTSGYAIRGEQFPTQTIIDMALARNIRLVAGSDAHRPEDVGRYFDRLGTLIDQ